MGGQAGVRTLREDIEEHAHPILHELAVMAIMGRRADTLERPAIEANTLESKFGKRGDRALSAPGMAIRPGFDCCGGSEAARGALGVLGCRSEERRVGKECVSRVDLGGRRIIENKKNMNRAKTGAQHT